MKTYAESEHLERSDTEITLGLRSILGIFFGLVLICGVFFGFGYSIGHGNARRATETAAQASSPSPQPAQPSAIRTVVEPATPAVAGSSGNSAYTYVAGPGGPTRKPAGTPLPVKPPAASSIPQATNPASSTPETPAVQSQAANAPGYAPTPVPASPAAAIMIQIAAVSHRQDADVLVSALGKLGYSASVHSETADNLLHVQIGPFATRDQAMVMRTKLLNDGYNAILK